MTKLELIRGILKLGQELDKSEGISSMMIIGDMERLVEKYTQTLILPIVVRRSEQLKESKKYIILKKQDSKE